MSGSLGDDADLAGCPSTRETGNTDIPASVRRLDGAWFGHDDLWVNAPRTAPAAGTKFGTVTLDDHGHFTDSKGPPVLTARRIGGTETAHMTGTDYSFENVGGDAVYFWPTTISLPRSGTWLMMETLGDTTLRFCVVAG